jgi:hypothetical protein
MLVEHVCSLVPYLDSTCDSALHAGSDAVQTAEYDISCERLNDASLT